jgi:hypothetical protein
VRTTIRGAVAHLADDRFFRTDFLAAERLVLSGDVVAAAGAVDWPSIEAA